MNIEFVKKPTVPGREKKKSFLSNLSRHLEQVRSICPTIESYLERESSKISLGPPPVGIVQSATWSFTSFESLWIQWILRVNLQFDRKFKEDFPYLWTLLVTTTEEYEEELNRVMKNDLVQFRKKLLSVPISKLRLLSPGSLPKRSDTQNFLKPRSIIRHIVFISEGNDFFVKPQFKRGYSDKGNRPSDQERFLRETRTIEANTEILLDKYQEVLCETRRFHPYLIETEKLAVRVLQHRLQISNVSTDFLLDRINFLIESLTRHRERYKEHRSQKRSIPVYPVHSYFIS